MLLDGLVVDTQTLVSLLALVALEIVLGIDNIVFIAIMVQRVPDAQRTMAYRLGLGGALITRLGLLFTLSWLLSLTKPWFTIFGKAISSRDAIMIVGGAFLIFKSSSEIFNKVEDRDGSRTHREGSASLPNILLQIMIIDIVFSLDSVITAVGMANQLWVMVVAMVVAVGVMLLFAKPVGDFVTKHPSMQVLALSFLLLIGVLLVADGMGQHMSKGYVYFAMGFSLAVEIFNLRMRVKVAKSSDATKPEVPSP